MEKIKYYGKDRLVVDMEPNDYALYSLSKILASKLCDKIDINKAFFMAINMVANYANDVDKQLLGDADMYDIVAYFTMKHKIALLEDAWEDMEENTERLKADKEEILTALAYVTVSGFINELDETDEE